MMDRPGVGMGVIVIKDGKVLLGKRKGSHGPGSWCFPGGKLEFKEQLEDCAKRETLEEAGISIKNIRMGKIFTNDIFEDEGRHFVTIFMLADHDSGEAKIMEPDKCEKWEWFEWNNLPEPLFIPLQNLRKQGFNPFE